MTTFSLRAVGGSRRNGAVPRMRRPGTSLRIICGLIVLEVVLGAPGAYGAPGQVSVVLGYPATSVEVVSSSRETVSFVVPVRIEVDSSALRSVTVIVSLSFSAHNTSTGDSAAGWDVSPPSAEVTLEVPARSSLTRHYTVGVNVSDADTATTEADFSTVYSVQADAVVASEPSGEIVLRVRVRFLVDDGANLPSPPIGVPGFIVAIVVGATSLGIAWVAFRLQKKRRVAVSEPAHR